MKLSSTQARPFTMTVLFLLLLLASTSEAAISCSDVLKELSPCLDYLKNGSGKPPVACCSGASTLASSATTTADKQTACNCLKTLSKSTTIKSDLAKALPGNCGISLPFTVSPDVDCSKIT